MKKKIYLYMMIVIFMFAFMFGCTKKDEENKSEDESQDVPPTLEQMQQLADEVVLTTMAQNWASSLDKAKEFQTSWNDLYPDLQKKGVKKEDVDAFVQDLNTLTDLLISKNLTSPQPAKPEGTGMQGQEEQQTQSKETEQKSEDSKEGENKEGENKEGGDDQGGEQKEDEKKQEEQSQQGQEDKKQEEDISSIEDENKDPKKILQKIDPMISIDQENLDIINASVEVTKYIPEFMTLFKSTVPPNIYKLKYFVRHLNIASRQQNWEAVNNGISSFTQTWESVESTATEADEDLRITLNQNIEELKSVVESKKVNLIGVKSNVLIENLDNLIKKIEDKEKEKKEEEKQ